MSASSTSSILRNVLSRPTNPAILPIPPRTTGFNVPKSLHKTRRYWHPNVTRSDYHLTVPGAFVTDRTSLPQAGGSSSAAAAGEVGVSSSKAIRGVKIQMRRRKDVEKAGGIEGLLLSRPSRHLTPFGRQLRSALFDELHRIRATNLADKQEIDQAVNDAPALSSSGPQQRGRGGLSGSISTGLGR